MEHGNKLKEKKIHKKWGGKSEYIVEEENENLKKCKCKCKSLVGEENNKKKKKSKKKKKKTQKIC